MHASRENAFARPRTCGRRNRSRPCVAASLEEGELVSGSLRAAEGVWSCIVRPARLETDLTGLRGEEGSDRVCVLPLSPLPEAPGRVVHLPAAGLLDPVQHP